MGGFHACNVFLAVIGKRFGSAGFRDFIVEPRLAGPDQFERTSITTMSFLYLKLFSRLCYD